MDKNAIKKYAVWARTELITRVSQRAEKYDITAEADVNATSVNGVLLSDAEKKQRKALIEQVKQKGLEQVMEEVSYTWFNRFIALRFMEVNGYLPSHIRVFTDDNNEFKPQILSEAIHLELDGLDMEKVYEMKNNNENDELYKYLIITQCNDLSKILPGMFQKISDYTELLFPDNILRDGSVVEQMVEQIPENDWNDQVQIIGWLYQYYNSEPKDKVFAELKDNIKITKEKVPAATQLFTPDWIVRYMVENSLGKLWLDGHKEMNKENWELFLEEANQDDDVAEKQQSIIERQSSLKPEDIKCIDPCCGSGHICAYIFDVLMDIYRNYGISNREAVKSIITNNLWGIDIDDRAAQLAYFSVMMKAVHYDRRFLRISDGMSIPQPHIYAIKESNSIDKYVIDYFVNGDSEVENSLRIVLDAFKDAKEYGSLIKPGDVNYIVLQNRIKEIENDIHIYKDSALAVIKPIIEMCEALSHSYNAVITNPPYMGSKGMSAPLLNYINANYPAGKSDLYAAFVIRCIDMMDKNGYLGLITPYVWMYLSSFEKLRLDILKRTNIVSLVQLEYNAFEVATVPVCIYVLRKGCMDYIGRFIQLAQFKGWDNQEPHVRAAIKDFSLDYCFESKQNNYGDIEGTPISYWLSDSVYKNFREAERVTNYGSPKQGLITGDNNVYMRLWYEVDFDKIDFHCTESGCSDKKWFPHSKGGSVRRWYGNNSYIVNWENAGNELKNFKDKKGKLRSRPQNEASYFKTGVTWSDLTISWFSARFVPEGFIFDGCGPTLIPKNNNDLLYLCGYFNSWVFQEFLNITCQGMHYSNGIIAQLPCILDNSFKDEISKLVERNIALSKADWDEHESSWDFKGNVLCGHGFELIEDAVNAYKEQKQCDVTELKNNEATLDDIFASIFGMKDITPSKGICEPTIYVTDDAQLVREYISYAVGCIMGRYSLDKEGIACAGEQFDMSNYISFTPDMDGIIPITDDEYFADDIVSLFINFVKTTFGESRLEDNLTYICKNISSSSNSREGIRNYFLNDFYTDHCNLFAVAGSGKRPIYWMLDSGKKGAFKCLIYMHRYKADTIARVRTDYVHELQSRYRTALEELENRVLSLNGSDKVKANKRLKIITEQSEELHVYEEKIHHLADQMISIDLDDGFKENYSKFSEILAKVK